MTDTGKQPADSIISTLMSLWGSRGGSVSSERKTAACRRNGGAPCKPGKRRGRPKKQKPIA